VSDRKGWIKVPATREGWTKVPATEATPDRSGDVRMVNASGKEFSVPASDVSSMETMGLRRVDAPLAEPDIAPEQEGLNEDQATALRRGALQGATFGFGDEGVGGITAGLQGLTNILPRALREKLDLVEAPAGEAYDYSRDLERTANKEAKAKEGGYYLGGELLGSLAAPIPGTQAIRGIKTGTKLGKALKLAAMAAQGAGIGGTAAAGASEADNAGDVLKEAGSGAVMGGGVGALFGGGSLLREALSKKAATGIEKAVADESANQATKAEKAANSAQGAYRSAIQSASRDLEVLERTANQTNDPQLAAEARAYLASEAGQNLIASVARSKLQTAPERIAEMGARKAEMEAARAAQSPEAIKAATDAALAHPIRDAVVPRLKTIGNRMVPIALGSAVGGAPGMVAGSVAGAMTGRQNTILANMLKNPGVRKMAWEAVQGMTGTEAQSLANALRQRATTGIGRGAEVVAPMERAAPVIQIRFNPVTGRPLTDEEEKDLERQQMAAALMAK
jgi:hypothetical protein